MDKSEFDSLNAVLDNIINNEDDIISPEQVVLMNKVGTAVTTLRAKMKRADRAGIGMGDRLKRLDDIDKQVVTFLKEYDR